MLLKIIFFSRIEEIYRDCIIQFRRRIAELERENALWSLASNIRANLRSNNEQQQPLRKRSRSPIQMSSVVAQPCQSERVPMNARPLGDLHTRLNANQGIRTHSYYNPVLSCHYCGSDHKMFECFRFGNLSLPEKERQVNLKGLCPNCFISLSSVRRHYCKFKHCRRCGPGNYHNSTMCPKVFE